MSHCVNNNSAIEKLIEILGNSKLKKVSNQILCYPDYKFACLSIKGKYSKSHRLVLLMYIKIVLHMQ